MIWDVDYGRNIPLKRVGHPCSLVKWSPDDSKLFSATVGGVFRVWDTENWTPERWTVKGGTIQSVAWSPCSKHLLFVTTEDQLIYALKFASEELFTSTEDQIIIPGVINTISFQVPQCQNKPFPFVIYGIWRMDPKRVADLKLWHGIQPENI